MNRIKNRVRCLMKELVRRACVTPTSSFGKYHATSRMDRPGYLVQSLSAEDRELLKTLTADDIKDIRWPP